jgi:ABC-type transport system involved in multi-copper enzyme maturation permease subunit
MRRRWGLGPVFVYEWLTASRRWQMYALRALFVGVLFLAVAVIWYAKAEMELRTAAVDRNAHARAGEALFYAFFGTLISMTLLVAPGATAGAVCQDKASGSLLHLLVTDLSSTEIVLGKLAVRLLPLLGLVVASVPVLSLCLWLGGIDPEAMLVAYVVTLGVAVLGGALAFLLSVWGRKTYEVLLATYLFEVMLLLAYPIGLIVDGVLRQTWLGPYVTWTNPYRLAFSPYLFRGATDLGDLTWFMSLCFGMSAVCTLLAVLTIRLVTVRQASSPPPRRRRKPLLRRPRWLTPRLDRNPVLWREWHRHRPSRWVRFVWAVYILGAVTGTTLVIYMEVGRNNRMGGETGAIISALQVSVGLLLASVGAVTSLAEERAQGSLDVLLATPLSTRSIVWGKWRGAFRLAPWLALLPTINLAAGIRPGNVPPWTPPGAPAPPPLHHPELIWLCVPLMFGLIVCYGAAVTSVGLACATWVRRQGRAIAISVIAYCLITVGWVALVGAIGKNQDSEKLMIASPFYGPGSLAAECSMTYRRMSNGLPDKFDATVAWAVGYAVVAGLVYRSVLATFDRSLGRMPERRFFVSPRGTARRSPRDNTKSLAAPRPPKHVPATIQRPGQHEQ